MTSLLSRPGAASAMVVSLLAVAATAVTSSAASGGIEPPRSSAPPSEVFTTIVASPLAAPHPVLGADGRRHLAYELQLINPFELAVTITRVETIDPATGDVLAVLEDDAVATHMQPLSAGGVTGSTLGPGATLLVLDVSLAPKACAPQPGACVQPVARPRHPRG